MPEGHSVHRIARQFARYFVGERVSASSPQGRFAAGATLLDGHVMTESRAVGKQLFLEFDDAVWLRVHLGIYGAWDFSGARSSTLPSIGAPRRTRVRMAEADTQVEVDGGFPPAPVGQVRLRLLTETVVADLRGPTACEVLDAAAVQGVISGLGPDPLVDDAAAGEERMLARIRGRRVPIGLLLMDQSVVSGIGNVYRAEILFRARLDPHVTGASLPDDVIRDLWRDWRYLLDIGVETGMMLTMDGLDEEAQRAARRSRADRYWVYKREGLPCRICRTNVALKIAAGRKLYWCPSCQQ